MHLSKKAASDDDNYLARALVFNQDEVVNHIDSLAPITSGLTTSEVITNSWSGLLFTGSASIFAKYDAIANQVGPTVSLAEQLAVPLLKRLSNSTTVSKLRPSRSQFLFGYHSEMGLFYVTGRGSYVQAKNALTQGILKLSGEKTSQSKIAKSVEQALDSLGEKSRLQTQITQQFLYFFNKEELQRGIGVYRNSQQTSADRAKLQTNISEAINTKSALSSKHYANYKSFEDIANKDIKTAKTRNFTGAMLQGVACVFLFTAVVNSSNKREDGSKLAAGISMLIAGEVERHSNAAKFRQNNLQMMQKAGKSIDGAELALLKNRAGFLRFGAGLLNIGGAAVFAYYDYQAAMTNFENNDNAMGVLYLTSAGSGVISTVLLAFGVSGSWVPVAGWVILGVSIVAGLAIMWFERTPLEKWLQYGTWGTDNKSWTFETEKLKLEKAANGEAIKI